MSTETVTPTAPAAAPRKPISLGAWLYIAAAVIGAWPVIDHLLHFIDAARNGAIGNLGFSGNVLMFLGQWDWILQNLLEPLVLFGGVALAFTKLGKAIRALPGLLFVLGFVFAFALTFAWGLTMSLGSDLLPSVWGWLVGDVPHAITYVLAVVLAGAAGLLTLTEKAPAGASSSVAAFAGAGERTPVGFDPQTGRPIYGYDVNTGQPIF